MPGRLIAFMKSRRAVPTSSQGQIAVLFALLMPVLLGVIGLVVDGGMAMVQYRRGQVALDSAALAAATQLDRFAFVDDNTMQLSPAEAVAAATWYAQENRRGNVAITGINISGTRVLVNGSVASPTIFMRIFGINQVRLNLSASAELKYGITEEGQ